MADCDELSLNKLSRMSNLSASFKSIHCVILNKMQSIHRVQPTPPLQFSSSGNVSPPILDYLLSASMAPEQFAVCL
jgi:hypothetical protein